MNLGQVRDRIKKIEKMKYDDELAHNEEKKLWEDVLTAIASGCGNAMFLAQESLKTKEINFQRWFA